MTQVLTLKESISIQAGSVVSREIIKNDGGTITLFAFDKGQGLSEHKTPYEAVAQIIEGRAQITVGGELYEVVEGQAILMPANIPHSLNASEPFKMILTMLKA
jgi:quercetin dioxygenase-like cupin family protein